MIRRLIILSLAQFPGEGAVGQLNHGWSFDPPTSIPLFLHHLHSLLDSDLKAVTVTANEEAGRWLCSVQTRSDSEREEECDCPRRSTGGGRAPIRGVAVAVLPVQDMGALPRCFPLNSFVHPLLSPGFSPPPASHSLSSSHFINSACANRFPPSSSVPQN